ncbi:hypothetical protein [Pontiella agarivorans]|uniref:VWFA domain-containing protein n=1 Tax=Pontiella agarivorans TaxID=3038953 RepID=A0ABU5MZ44_9BACT|nr:hypothetical protein [Pontiella agarivorans]MDZ8119458.1 hypothetical protein [Pontiella agarivorans]
MEVQKTKKRIANSSAAILSIALHAILILVAGGVVALKYYQKQGAAFQVEKQRPKLERRKLQMPVKAQPFMEQMSKPKSRTTTRITANAPQLVNIPEQGEYVKMAPMPTFKSGYTNFVQMDRTLEFNSKYRDVNFGISSVDFFGTRGKAEKVVVVVDASRSMLFDDRGGIESYNMVHEDLREVVGSMRSATLFNVILFDDEQVALFNANMIPATPTAKTNVIEWVGGINTNLDFVGLPNEFVNYTPKRAYDIPMANNDITGWMKGMQAAIEQKPEIIFLLTADWGNITSMNYGLSYFLKKDMFKEYQKRRIKYFLEDETFAEEWEGYLAEYDELRTVAIKMLELENQARYEAEMQPKVVRDWDEILYDNNVELPAAPLAEDQQAVGMMPSETRYTLDEVLESFFVIVMDNYRNLGFPRFNFVLLQGNGAANYTAEKASMMTSDIKFQNLSKMVDGRFRFLKGMPRISNLLDQTIDDAMDAILQDEEGEL